MTIVRIYLLEDKGRCVKEVPLPSDIEDKPQ